jgi:predicted nucleic acid-binding protein
VVVDASVAVQWFSREPGAEAAARLLGEHRPLIAPDMMPIEVANALWKKVRRGDMAIADLERSLVRLLGPALVLISTAPMLPRAARLAVELDHPVYDCVYLSLAEDQRATLATADARLRRAARARAIPLWRA